MAATSEGYVVVGQVAGLYGVHGWLKVYAYTRERDDILAYDHWFLRRGDGWERRAVRDGRAQSGGIVAQIEGIDDRDAARALIGTDIAIQAEQLAPLSEGEYYWSQLEGLQVVTATGIELGRVSHLLETGSNDVLVVIGERERLLPYTAEVVRSVDLAGRVITVDWDPEF